MSDTQFAGFIFMVAIIAACVGWTLADWCAGIRERRLIDWWSNNVAGVCRERDVWKRRAMGHELDEVRSN